MLLTLAIVCGMLSAQMAMAGERAHPQRGLQAASHCEDRRAKDDTVGDHAPTKQPGCKGACFGVQPRVSSLPARIASSLGSVAIPAMASFGDVLIEHDPPPPRLA